MLAWLEMYKLPNLASLYAARKAFCTIIAAVGMSISLLGTLGCDVMKGGRGRIKTNVTMTLFGPIIVWRRPLALVVAS